ncbi:hypothetical protein D6789_01085 [Candidatus Woesearchaeota archaeon]|nr:MAG: hypothetical protein D6789_01085 [Candidatus Woesearchaeota archaeon]
MALAAEPGESDVTTSHDHGEFLYTTTDSISLESGNISEASLESNMSTYRWTGLYGNVTGNIVLGDSNSNQLFAWTAQGRVVYASELATINWANLADADWAATETDYTFLNVSGSADDYNNTFAGAAENIGSLIFTTLTSDYATTLSSGSTTWKTYSLTDASGGTDIIFAGRVVQSGTTYNGETADFQMILPEDGTANDNTPTTFNLWVELV